MTITNEATTSHNETTKSVSITLIGVSAKRYTSAVNVPPRSTHYRYGNGFRTIVCIINGRFLFVIVPLNGDRYLMLMFISTSAEADMDVQIESNLIEGLSTLSVIGTTLPSNLIALTADGATNHVE